MPCWRVVDCVLPSTVGATVTDWMWFAVVTACRRGEVSVEGVDTSVRLGAVGAARLRRAGRAVGDQEACTSLRRIVLRGSKAAACVVLRIPVRKPSPNLTHAVDVKGVPPSGWRAPLVRQCPWLCGFWWRISTIRACSRSIRPETPLLFGSKELLRGWIGNLRHDNARVPRRRLPPRSQPHTARESDAPRRSRRRSPRDPRVGSQKRERRVEVVLACANIHGRWLGRGSSRALRSRQCSKRR